MMPKPLSQKSTNEVMARGRKTRRSPASDNYGKRKVEHIDLTASDDENSFQPRKTPKFSEPSHGHSQQPRDQWLQDEEEEDDESGQLIELSQESNSGIAGEAYELFGAGTLELNRH